MRLVYKYALATPDEGRDLVEEQMRAAHRYRNTLTEIERGRRAAVRQVEAEAGDMPAVMESLHKAESDLALALQDIKKHRARTRKRDEPATMKAAAKAARDAKRDASKAFRDLRSRIAEDPTVIAAKDAINERAAELRRSAREHSGAYWGTYLLVEDAASTAFKDTPMYASDGHPTDPAFVRWTGEGEVGVQLQGGLGADEATACTDTQLQITQPDERAWERRGRTHRECEQMARQAQLRMRVQSDAKGKPVWATWRMDMHRPLPEGAIIKLATVHRVRVGPHSKWYVTLTLDVPARVRVSQSCGTVAVDVGWRVVGDELRVAGWQDTAGARGELRLNARDIAMLRAPEAMRSERDKRFDAARASLLGWLRSHQEHVPEWLTQATTTLHAWRSEARLVALCSRWSENRFQGDDQPYYALASWKARARHEWAFESRAREQALRRRREKYRVWAAQLTSKYDTILIEKFDKREVAVIPAPDVQVEQNAEQAARDEAARSNRVVASTSELCSCLVTAARSRGCTVIAVPCEDTTRTCPVCGLVESRDAAAAIELTCECGAAWDQDVDGAPAVLLARARERPGDTKILVDAREEEKQNENGEKKEGRWERARRLRNEKEARMKAAREAAPDGAE
jgi:hypothetical protein